MQSHLVTDSNSTPKVRSNSEYALGYTNGENDRLIRQAERVAPVTERLFREAGIGPGQRVLDLGSGMGDVAMLAARLVGPSGQVVGVERDANSIARAEARVAAAGLHNVEFTQSDVNNIASDRPFDAAVGRFILMFLPDPASALRSVARLVRPRGVLAFQEPSWVPYLAAGARLPLWSSVLCSIHETFLRSGVNPEMGPDLYRIFQEVGLPSPTMHMETLLGIDAEFTRVLVEVLGSLRPLAQQHNVPLERLGDFDTLADRVHAEIAASNSIVSFVPMVGVWSRVSSNGSKRPQNK
jgi:ubiquinone/menaquinone biosynthesis C-methylase UbiE